MNTASTQLELIRRITDIQDENLLQSIKHFIVQRQHLQQSQGFSEAHFWKVIALLDWKEEGEDENVLAPAVQYLSGLDTDAILRFYDILSEKLYHLDTEAQADASIGEEEHFSSDLFLYARCAIVANGKELYEQVLQKPALFPKDIFFEALLALPDKAYELKTGKELDYLPTFVYETGFNVIGWGEKAIQL